MPKRRRCYYSSSQMRRHLQCCPCFVDCSPTLSPVNRTYQACSTTFSCPSSNGRLKWMSRSACALAHDGLTQHGVLCISTRFLQLWYEPDMPRHEAGLHVPKRFTWCIVRAATPDMQLSLLPVGIYAPSSSTMELPGQLNVIVHTFLDGVVDQRPGNLMKRALLPHAALLTLPIRE